ncbi:MAG: succinylglutamate desuccinylase/aspartoacylase family protein [Vicinamibacterales bacterium]
MRETSAARRRFFAGVAAIATAIAVTTPRGEARQASRPFAIGGTSVPAGQRADVDLVVPAGAGDPATAVLTTVFHGARPGRALALTAGVHGFEYAPILAAQRLRDRIDPATLAGTVILVRLAHVAAFEQRVPFVNPFDRKNLNRMFPGTADGSQAERIAWTLTTEVIRRSDLHVELHGGDGAEWLEAFAGAYGGPLAAAQYADARRMALAFGLPNYVKYSMNTQAQVDSGRSLNRQAVADGTPTVLVEIGENGRTDDAFVTPIVTGVENLLREFGMNAGTPPPRADTRWFDDTTGVSAKTTGIFTPVATTGRVVKAGATIGTIRDYRRALVETVVSPIDGYVLYGLAGPPVVAGDSVATIGRPATGPL